MVEPLLTALWHSEFQCRLNLYRTAIILLADISLEFGMTKRCRRILEEIMPQVIWRLLDWCSFIAVSELCVQMITGGDLEQRAFACFTFARCIMAASDIPSMFHKFIKL